MKIEMTHVVIDGKRLKTFYGSNSIFQVKKKGTAVAKQKAEENDYFQQMEKVPFYILYARTGFKLGPDSREIGRLSLLLGSHFP